MGHGRNKGKGNAEGELALNLLIIDYCFVRSQFAALLSLLRVCCCKLKMQIARVICQPDPVAADPVLDPDPVVAFDVWRRLGEKQIFINF